MHLIVVIGFILSGILMIAMAIAHEYTWWKRRGWRRGRGFIVGFKEEWNDGVSYHPEIQFEGSNGLTKFVSKYGSGKKPAQGVEVDILIDKSGKTGEQISTSNRMIFTIVPIIFGVLFITIGINIEPLKPVEQSGVDQSAAALEPMQAVTDWVISR